MNIQCKQLCFYLHHPFCIQIIMDEEESEKLSIIVDKLVIEDDTSQDFPEEGLKGEDLEWVETRIYQEEDQDTSRLKSLKEETDSKLHSKFINFSLENELQGEELDWFKARICPLEFEVKRVTAEDLGPVKVKILTEADVEEAEEKPEKFVLRLTETNTIWFFSMETKWSLNDPEDAEKVRRENETYQMKKTKKEFIRKRCMADAQTPRFLEKSTGTVTTPINKEDAVVFASEWDLYDTYSALDKYELAPSGKYFKLMDARKSSDAPDDCLPSEGLVRKKLKSSDFEYASLVTERLLAGNCFRPEQLVFKTKFKTRYDTEPSLFSYKMEELWDFRKDFEHPLFVTAFDWNPLNQDLLAVGYGDLEYQGKAIGSICVWSPKNPCQPEREIRLEDSVTSLHYSRVRPNVLAFGTRSGSVHVTDISVSEGKLKTLTSWKSHPGPIWKVEWFLHNELNCETEKLLAVGESGVVMLFFPEGGSRDILKLDYVTSTPNLPEKLPPKKIYRRPLIQDEIFDKKTFSGLYFSIFFDKNFCYVATKEGALVKCNLRNPSMTDGIFLAHDGPVYVTEHSPVTDLVYLTCGADWKIKIWMEGITEPLITLQHTGPVMCARWSPTIPTLIASITDYTLAIWDIARNILSPMSVKNFEDLEQPLSVLIFSKNGANVVLGNQNGVARVVNLSELPRIPFLQKEALIGTIGQALEKKENNLLEKFSRAVKANREKLKTKIIEDINARNLHLG